MIGIFTWRNGSIVAANDAFLNMLDYSKADLAGGQLSMDLLAPTCSKANASTGRRPGTGAHPAHRESFAAQNQTRNIHRLVTPLILRPRGV